MISIRTIRTSVATVAMLLAPFLARADVKLPSVFGDHMVLQRGQTIPVWGWADAGEKVSVTLGSETQTTVADENGKWRVSFKPLDASASPIEMKVEGKNARTIGDILVGDVWLCSGQSNMEWPVRNSKASTQEIADADYPQIRLLHVRRAAVEKPADDVSAEWGVCSPQVVPNFSAVGYFFGRKLHQDLKVPIGLIESNWGGTPAESWTDRATLENEPELANVLSDYRKVLADYPDAKEKHEAEMKNWRATTQALEKGAKAPAPPRARQ